MSEYDQAWLDQMNRPCLDPTHERMPDPARPGRTRCRTCKQAIVRKSLAKARKRDRDAVLAAYGGVCACCGEHRDVFLSIDHVDGNGAAHRRELAGGKRRAGTGNTIYRWLCKQGFPAGFQILCFNCNFAKHRLGECPHETERKDHGQLAR